MKEILDLKQELLMGNFDEAIKLTTELETIAYQDKLNAIKSFLTLIVSRLILLQVGKYIYMSNIYEIRNSLLEIQLRNRLGDGFYIQGDSCWQKLIEQSIPWALLIAAEETELREEMDVSQLKEVVDYKLLQVEALSIIRLIFSLDAYGLDQYLRSRWINKQLIRY